MYYVSSLQFHDGELVAVETRKAGEFDLMQCTGKKDKNGKEMFEGDIILVYGEKRLIEFKHMFWHWKELGGFGTESDAGHKPLYRYADPLIVGNMYENPELLNELEKDDDYSTPHVYKDE